MSHFYEGLLGLHIHFYEGLSVMLSGQDAHQPFMAIDDYSAAVLTEEQREQLLALSDDLPGLLERLDARKNVRDKENNLTEVLSEYFLKSYLSSIL